MSTIPEKKTQNTNKTGKKKKAVPHNPNEWPMNFSVEKKNLVFFSYQKYDFGKIKHDFLI